jgi:Spy/CpxP family protein refolding chaperone
MKKYAMLALATVFMFSVSVSAQDQVAPQAPKGEKKEQRQGGGVEKRVEKMATDLGLNDTEKESVKVLMTNQEAAIQKFRAENDKESADFKQKFKELRKSQDAVLKAVIGDVKFEKLQAIRAEQKAKMEKKAE